MPRWNVVVLAALLGFGVALPASAQWKWRDKNGQTQYSDLPPPLGTPEASILQRPAPTASARRAAPPAAAASAALGAPLLAARASDPELEARRKKAEQEVVEKKKAEETKVAAARAENCTRAKDQLRTLDSGMRIARTDAKGEQVILDDVARAAEIKRTRDIMASDCK